MDMTKEEFHRLASALAKDWLWRLIFDKTGDSEFARTVQRAASAISFHDMMSEAYENSGLMAGNFSLNQAIDAPDGIYDRLKEII